MESLTATPSLRIGFFADAAALADGGGTASSAVVTVVVCVVVAAPLVVVTVVVVVGIVSARAQQRRPCANERPEAVRGGANAQLLERAWPTQRCAAVAPVASALRRPTRCHSHSHTLGRFGNADGARGTRGVEELLRQLCLAPVRMSRWAGRP